MCSGSLVIDAVGSVAHRRPSTSNPTGTATATVDGEHPRSGRDIQRGARLASSSKSPCSSRHSCGVAVVVDEDVIARPRSRRHVPNELAVVQDLDPVEMPQKQHRRRHGFVERGEELFVNVRRRGGNLGANSEFARRVGRPGKDEPRAGVRTFELGLDDAVVLLLGLVDDPMKPARDELGTVGDLVDGGESDAHRPRGVLPSPLVRAGEQAERMEVAAVARARRGRGTSRRRGPAGRSR